MVQTRIEVLRYTAKMNPDVLYYNITLKKIDDKPMFDVDLYLVRDLGVKLTAKVDILMTFDEKKRRMLTLPKVNYCDIRRGMFGPLAIYKEFVESFYKYGNLSQPCPLKRGYYYFKDLYIDDSILPTFVMSLAQGVYVVQTVLYDEMSKSKTWVSNNEFYIDFAGKFNF
jgi:Protein of unknown function (DUF1091)